MPTLREPGRFASGALAVLVHLMFFGFLVFGLSWQKKVSSPIVVDLWQDLPESTKKAAPLPEPPKPAPKIIPKPPEPVPEVRKVVPPPAPPKVEAPKPSAADIELKEKLRKQKEEEALQREELRKAELERKEEQRRAELERKEEQKRAELEKRRLEEEQRKAAEEQRRIEAEQKRAEQEKLRQEEEARRVEEAKRVEEQRRIEQAKLEEDRKQRAAAAERERQQLEAARKQRDAEDAKRRAEAAARAAQQKLIDDAKARIQAQIKSRVVVPPNIEGNPEARFEVTVLPGGEVLKTELKKSSGSPAYDAAVERAIARASPLPVPTDPELFQEFRELDLRFRPKD